MRARPFALLVMSVVSAAGLLAGCGSDSSGSASGSGDDAAALPGGPDLRVVGKSFSYEPERITIKGGERPTLAFTSKDILHDFTVKELDIKVTAAGGRTKRQAITFDNPGRYEFYCSVAGHREAGMEGTLVVEP